MNANQHLVGKPHLELVLERGSVSRSTRAARKVLAFLDGLSADESAAGHRPALRKPTAVHENPTLLSRE
ncbi:MAG: hypothetical protein DMG45_00405 [Acidobacteria bacterium]|nr:MAG: hypothetical protein DMG45_00405 [Acidobacteriota bacterium]